jgi:hypothetical protein
MNAGYSSRQPSAVSYQVKQKRDPDEDRAQFFSRKSGRPYLKADG